MSLKEEYQQQDVVFEQEFKFNLLMHKTEEKFIFHLYMNGALVADVKADIDNFDIRRTVSDIMETTQANCSNRSSIWTSTKMQVLDSVNAFVRKFRGSLVDRLKNVIDESKVTDYINSDELHKLISDNPKLNKYKSYIQRDDMVIDFQNHTKHDGVGPHGGYNIKTDSFKFVKGVDGNWQVYQLVDGVKSGDVFDL